MRSLGHNRNGTAQCVAPRAAVIQSPGAALIIVRSDSPNRSLALSPGFCIMTGRRVSKAVRAARIIQIAECNASATCRWTNGAPVGASPSLTDVPLFFRDRGCRGDASSPRKRRIALGASCSHRECERRQRSLGIPLAIATCATNSHGKFDFSRWRHFGQRAIASEARRLLGSAIH